MAHKQQIAKHQSSQDSVHEKVYQVKRMSLCGKKWATLIIFD
jgi:hypothetical protein